MKVIITGSKDVVSYTLVVNAADKLGEAYAKNNSIELLIMKEDRDKFEKSAGYRRMDTVFLVFAAFAVLTVVLLWLD